VRNVRQLADLSHFNLRNVRQPSDRHCDRPSQQAGAQSDVRLSRDLRLSMCAMCATSSKRRLIVLNWRKRRD